MLQATDKLMFRHGGDGPLLRCKNLCKVAPNIQYKIAVVSFNLLCILNLTIF